MIEHGEQLELPTCPYCGVDRPNLERQYIDGQPVFFETTDYKGREARAWSDYVCRSCGGVVLAAARRDSLGILLPVHFVVPDVRTIQDEVPERPRHYLDEAVRALATPSAALMVCASAVDAMLKERGFTEGSLYARIDKAAAEHVITQDMATWAHHVRLEANGQRHADEAEALPTKEDAERSLEFALSLAEFLFVLPARVRRGLSAVKPE